MATKETRELFTSGGGLKPSCWCHRVLQVFQCFSSSLCNLSLPIWVPMSSSQWCNLNPLIFHIQLQQRRDRAQLHKAQWIHPTKKAYAWLEFRRLAFNTQHERDALYNTLHYPTVKLEVCARSFDGYTNRLVSQCFQETLFIVFWHILVATDCHYLHLFLEHIK